MSRNKCNCHTGMLGALKLLAFGPRASVKRHWSELWSSLLIHIRRKKVKGARWEKGGVRVLCSIYPFSVLSFRFSVVCFLLIFADFVSVVFLLAVSCFPSFHFADFYFLFPFLFTVFFSVPRFALSDSYFRCSVNPHTTTTTIEQIYRVSIPAFRSCSVNQHVTSWSRHRQQ